MIDLTSPTILKWAAVAIGGGSAGALTLAGLADERGLVRTALNEYRYELLKHSRALFLRWDVTALMLLQAAAIYASFALALAYRRVDLLVIAPVAAVAPKIVLAQLRRRRVAAIEAQTDTFILAFANALRSAASVGEAFRSLAPIVGEPLRSEVVLADKQMRLGATLEEALEAMARRIESRAFDTALAAVLVGQRVGGNLPEVLSTTGAAIRELHRLDRMSRAKTASARTQARAVAAAPVLFAYGADYLMPGYFSPLLESTSGKLVIVGVGVLWLFAIVLSRRILRVTI
jgi:tight adherence protein B